MSRWKFADSMSVSPWCPKIFPCSGSRYNHKTITLSLLESYIATDIMSDNITYNNSTAPDPYSPFIHILAPSLFLSNPLVAKSSLFNPNSHLFHLPKRPSPRNSYKKIEASAQLAATPPKGNDVMSVLHHLCQSLICQQTTLWDVGWDVQKSTHLYIFRSCTGFLPSLSKFFILNEMPSAQLWLPLKTQIFWLPAICIPKTGCIRPCQGSFCSHKIGLRANGVHGSPVRPTRFWVVVYPIRCLSPLFVHKFSEHLHWNTNCQHQPPPPEVWIPRSLLTTSSSLCSTCDAPQHALKLVEVQVPRAASARRNHDAACSTNRVKAFASSPRVISWWTPCWRTLGCYFCCHLVTNCCLRWRIVVHPPKQDLVDSKDLFPGDTVKCPVTLGFPLNWPVTSMMKRPFNITNTWGPTECSEDSY